MECIHRQVSSAVRQTTDCPVRPTGLESESLGMPCSAVDSNKHDINNLTDMLHKYYSVLVLVVYT